MSDRKTHALKQQNDERQTLIEVVSALMQPVDTNAMLQASLEKIVAGLETAQAGLILLCDARSGSLRPAAVQGIGPLDGATLERSYAWELARQSYEHAAARFSADSPGRAPLPGFSTEEASLLAAPVGVQGDRYGALVLASLPGHPQLTRAHIPLVETLCEIIGLALRRAEKSSLPADSPIRPGADTTHSERMSALSHELRLPLTAIMGYASALLLDEIEWTREKQIEFINRIVEESESMQVMLSDLLDSSLMESDQFSIQPQALRLGPFVREVAEEMQYRTDKHRILAELSLDFPMVQADPNWLKQVLRNILDNAIKYSPEGGLVVVRGEARRDDIVISIADQGIGIAPENMPPLFEKYYRVKSPGGVQVPGTGLGLPIARTIVEAHGGRIWVESLLGQGTTVSFSLPRPEADGAGEG